MARTYLDLIWGSLAKIGVSRAGDTLAPEIADVALAELNRLFDDLNADGVGAYVQAFSTFTITANHQPHSIGPSSDWVVTQRPVEILGAALVDTTTTRAPIDVHNDPRWWLDKRDRGLTSTMPSDLYFEPGWPAGSVYLWPVPTQSWSIELLLRSILASVALTTTVSLPPGYDNFLTYALAEACAAVMGQPLPQQVASGAERGRARVYSNNRRIPRTSTQDAGLPGASRSTRFDPQTRSWTR